MKLIDLLVKELPKMGGWPEGAVEAEVFTYEGGLVNFRTEEGHALAHGAHAFKARGLDLCEIESVSRAQYEAAIAKNDCWIEWGGACPADGAVDVKLRNGHITTNRMADSLDWNHYTPDGEGAIIAYRLHKPDLNSRANDDRMEQDLNECIGQGVQWQGDGVPHVGCACEMQDSKGTWLPVEIIAKNDGFTFGWSYDYRIVLFGDKADEFRPLRAEGERAREKLAASLHVAAGASPIELNGIGPLYFKLADAIISGSVFGTTFKENK